MIQNPGKECLETYILAIKGMCFQQVQKNTGFQKVDRVLWAGFLRDLKVLMHTTLHKGDKGSLMRPQNNSFLIKYYTGLFFVLFFFFLETSVLRVLFTRVCWSLSLTSPSQLLLPSTSPTKPAGIPCGGGGGGGQGPAQLMLFGNFALRTPSLQITVQHFMWGKSSHFLWFQSLYRN